MSGRGMRGWAALPALWVAAAGCTTDTRDPVLDASPVVASTEVLDLEMGCDVEYTRTIDYDSGAQIVETHWYAEADVPGLSPARVRNVSTIVCDYESLGADPFACPTGAACSGFLPPVAYQCQSNTHADFRDGTVRVLCGIRQDFTSIPDTAPSTSGWRWRSARVRFELDTP